MSRKKKKQPINIKSTETQILVGIILFTLGLAVTITNFVGQESQIFKRRISIIRILFYRMGHTINIYITFLPHKKQEV